MKGKLLVVSAPSGAGKTSLCNILLDAHENIKYSVSYTTRDPRPDEKNGIDYFFVNEAEFKKMIDHEEFIEWAFVHGNYYGTSKTVIENALDAGQDILLDIDPQGARQLKNKLGYGVYIFIVAPSIDDLEKRLRNRRTETEEKLKLRLENARKEIEHFKDYDYIIVNDDIDRSFKDFESIYIAEHLRSEDIADLKQLMKF